LIERLLRITAREEGLEEGRKEGRKEGMEKGIEKRMQEGMQEGVEKGRKKTARNMIEFGMSSGDIAKICGLDVGEVEMIMAKQKDGRD